MSIRGSVGSLIESHRAKGSHPDRRNIIPKLRRICGATRFTGSHPQSGSVVTNAQEAFPFARMSNPFARGTVPFAQTTFRFAQTLFCFARAVPPFARMTFAFAQGSFPIAQTPFPSAQGLFPIAQTSNPFAQGAFSISKILFPRQLWRFWELFKRIAYWDSGDPEMHFDNPNLIWSDPSYLLEPGDPGYVPPSPPTPTTNKIMNHKPNCPVPVIIYNGNLVVAAGNKYPKVAAGCPPVISPRRPPSSANCPRTRPARKRPRARPATSPRRSRRILIRCCIGWARRARRPSWPFLARR